MGSATCGLLLQQLAAQLVLRPVGNAALPAAVAHQAAPTAFVATRRRLAGTLQAGAARVAALARGQDVGTPDSQLAGFGAQLAR